MSETIPIELARLITDQADRPEVLRQTADQLRATVAATTGGKAGTSQTTAATLLHLADLADRLAAGDLAAVDAMLNPPGRPR